MDTYIQSLVEATIYAAGKRGVKREVIMEKSGVDAGTLELAITTLKAKYPNDGTSGLVLNDFGETLSLSTYSKVSEQVGDILLKDKQKELTGALLETLAIIAYEQPITRGEIERIRGVNSDYAINVLQIAKLIYVSGKRQTLGTPKEYSTTDEFLLKFELKNIYELANVSDIQNRLTAITDAAENKTLFKEVTSDFAKLELDENVALIEDDLDFGPSMGAGESDYLDEEEYLDEDEVFDESDSTGENE